MRTTLPLVFEAFALGLFSVLLLRRNPIRQKRVFFLLLLPLYLFALGLAFDAYILLPPLGILAIYLGPLLVLGCRPPEKGDRILSGFLLLFSLVPLVFAAWIADFFLVTPYSIIYCAIFIILSLAVAVPVSRHLHSRVLLLPALLFCAAVVVYDFGAFTNVKCFRRFYAQIQPGMTRPEIEAALQHAFAGTGFLRPEVRDPADGPDEVEFLLCESPGRDYDAFIKATFQKGRVTEKRYDRD
jgi:hypothetical protein